MGGEFMELFGLLEKSNAFRYAMLSTKVSQIISHIEKGNCVDEKSCAILARGADLLKQIIEGSILIERKGAMYGFSPSQEGLSVYGHALSALGALELINKEKDFTVFFLDLFNEMNTLSRKGHVDEEKLTILRNFFNTISYLFSEDIQKDTFKTPLGQTTPHYCPVLPNSAVT
jgi:hypothetical protein